MYGQSLENEPGSKAQQRALENFRKYLSEALETGQEAEKAREMLSHLGFGTQEIGSLDIPLDKLAHPERPFIIKPSVHSDETEPFEWTPKVTYTVDSSPTKRSVHVELNSREEGRRKTATVTVDELGEGCAESGIPDHYFSEVERQIHQIESRLSDLSEREASPLDALRTWKMRAIENRDRLKERASKLLHQVSFPLLGWSAVASRIEWKETKPQRPKEISDRPKWSDLRSGFFDVWRDIYRRQLQELNLASMAEPLNIPSVVTERAEDAIEALYDELVSLDEQVLPYQARIVACNLVKDKLAESSGPQFVSDSTSESKEPSTHSRQSQHQSTSERFSSTTPDRWEQNAALMHAYLERYGPPDSLTDLEEKIKEKGGFRSFSYERAWRRLKEEGYAPSSGLNGLISALEKWALDFEKEYGPAKAAQAAKPFEWPFQQDKYETS